MSCPFCDIEAMTDQGTRKWYEDDYSYAVLEEEQTVKGYTLFIPKQHFDTITDMTMPGGLVAIWWRTIQELCNILKETLGAEAVYAVTLCEGIRHFHFHLIPRYKGSDIGFQYMARIEREINDTDFMAMPLEQRQIALNNLVIALCTK